MNRPTLSIVIIGLNEGERLTRCLSSLQNITAYHLSEIIYVDSDSSDDSIERAKRFTTEIIKIQPEKPAPGIARNIGWKKATGEYILFLDGDTVLHPHFLPHALPAFANPKIGIVCGKLDELFPTDSIFHRVFNLDWNSPCGFIDACGGNALIRRKTLEDVKGYDSSLIAGEEPEMCCRIRRKGYLILRLDVQMGYHDLNMHKLNQYWSRTFRTGYAYAEMAQRQDPSFTRKAQHNLWKGGLLLSSFFIAILLSAYFLSLIPLFAYVTLWIGMVTRTLLKTHANSWLTRFLYSCHTHFQHIPMLFGQLKHKYLKRKQEAKQCPD